MTKTKGQCRAGTIDLRNLTADEIDASKLETVPICDTGEQLEEAADKQKTD